MDINKKLSYYRTQQKPKVQEVQAELPASVKAIAETLEAKVLFAQAPILQINRTHTFNFPKKIKLDLLSKNVFKDDISVYDLLFFDLETTGLAGGAGTFPFLVGLGYFDNDSFKTELFFLPDYGREYYLYRHLSEKFQKYKFFVSYNGKSYDLPLLKNRFVLNRIDFEWDKLEHIDLVHFARRIWKDSFSGLELTSLERNLLNRFREGDIPGAFIPEAYFSYLKTGRIHEILQIIEHNYLDIISLAELIVKIDEIENNFANITDEQVLLRLAKLAYQLRNEQILLKIDEAYQHNKNKQHPKINFYKSMLAKISGNWKFACSLWEELLKDENYQMICLEELAKYQEHKKKNINLALEYTERGLGILNRLSELNPYLTESDVFRAFTIRKKRLNSKLS